MTQQNESNWTLVNGHANQMLVAVLRVNLSLWVKRKWPDISEKLAGRLSSFLLPSVSIIDFWLVCVFPSKQTVEGICAEALAFHIPGTCRRSPWKPKSIPRSLCSYQGDELVNPAPVPRASNSTLRKAEIVWEEILAPGRLILEQQQG